jgi:YD repeat-containing protein
MGKIPKTIKKGADMRHIALLALFLAPALCLGADRFLLDSELRTNFADDGSTTQTLTGYTYDASGNRIVQRIWNGADSATTAMSTDQFTYNASGGVTQELLLSGSDTLTIVRYVYAGDNIIAVHTLTKDGTLRFTDSLIYDGQEHAIEEQRISSAGVKTYFHRYTLNAQGKIVSDSLYELVSGSYVASQAVLFTYNTDTTVASETQWRLSGASWYCISTAFMRYAAGSLVSVATHQRDGVGTGMIDSLAYTYDANGNRTKEEDYNDTKALLHRIVYTWRDTKPTIALMNEKMRSDQRFVISNKQGQLKVDCASRNRGEISIYDMTGKRLCRIEVDHSGTVPLQRLIGKGLYIAVFTSGANRQMMNFTN